MNPSANFSIDSPHCKTVLLEVLKRNMKGAQKVFPLKKEINSQSN